MNSTPTLTPDAPGSLNTTLAAVRTRPAPRAVRVHRLQDLSPRMRRVTFSGDSLEGFGPPKPGSHIKLLFGEAAAGWQPGSGQPRPTMRTYTPRRFDPVRRELVVDFVRHGQGVASDWVEQARVGSTLLIAGPGGGQVFPESLRHLVLLADESALPAVGTILDSLHTGCQVTLMAEVEAASDQINLGDGVSPEVRWLVRSDSQAAPGALLLQAAQAIGLPEGAMVWVACEATAMRDIRQVLLQERGMDRAQLVTRGYWKLGASDHPDHDMGDDAP